MQLLPMQPLRFPLQILLRRAVQPNPRHPQSRGQRRNPLRHLMLQPHFCAAEPLLQRRQALVRVARRQPLFQCHQRQARFLQVLRKRRLQVLPHSIQPRENLPQVRYRHFRRV